MNNNDKIKTIQNVQDGLNELQLIDCEKIAVGEVLHFLLDENTKKTRIRAILRYIADAFISSLNFEIVGNNPQKIMLFSNSYVGRNDHLLAFENVCKTTRDYLKITPGKKKIRINLGLIKQGYNWYKNINEVIHNKSQALYLTTSLHKCFCDYTRTMSFCANNGIDPMTLVVLCDVMPIDSFFVQKYNLEGKNTITLQHGTFAKNSYMYTHSMAKYFIASGQFSKDLAIESGLKETQVYIAGAPQYLGRNPISSNKEKTIGLILTGGESVSIDIQIIDYATKLKREKHYKILAKLHPGTKESDYPAETFKHVDEIVANNTSIQDYAKNTSFFIDGGSTVFSESMFCEFPDFTFSSPTSPYNGRNFELAFSNYNSLNKLVELFENDKIELRHRIIKNKNYLSTVEDVATLYARFFDYIIENEPIKN